MIKFKQFIKKYIVYDIKWKLISIVAAISLWVFASFLSDPTGHQPYTRPLEIRGISHLATSELVLLNDTALRSRPTQVYITARNSTIERISIDYISTFIDLRDIEVPTNLPTTIEVPIQAEINSPFPLGGGYIIGLPTASTMATIFIDSLSTLPKELEIEVTADVPTGHRRGNITTTVQSVNITGPASLINNVSRAVVNLNLSELIEDTNLRATTIILDDDGNDITNDFTLSHTTVPISVAVSPIVVEPPVPPPYYEEPEPQVPNNQPQETLTVVSVPSSQLLIVGGTGNVTIQDYINVSVYTSNPDLLNITGTIDVTGLDIGVHYIPISLEIIDGTIAEPAFAIVTITDAETETEYSTQTTNPDHISDLSESEEILDND